MSAVALCAFALLAVVLSITVRESQPRFSALVVTAAGVVFWLFAVKELLPVVQAMADLTEKNGLSDSFSALFRALGLALVISFSAGFCRDLGENGVAEKLEFCGKIAVLSLALPTLKALIAAIVALLS